MDSETLMGLFEANGYHVTHDADNPTGDIAVVNTCGFIEDAKQESIDTILELAQAKEEGRLKKHQHRYTETNQRLHKALHR